MGSLFPSTQPGQNGARRRQQRFGDQEGVPKGALCSHPFPSPPRPRGAPSSRVGAGPCAQGVARLWLGKLETLLGAALAARETSHVRKIVTACCLPLRAQVEG